MIMVTSAMVRLRPINLTSMAMEDAQAAEADSEKSNGTSHAQIGILHERFE